MGSLSDFGENELLQHLFDTAHSPASAVYLALCTADPTDAGTGAACNEVANSNNYARTAITFGAAASRKVTQNADVTFPEASGPWGTVTHWCIIDTNTYGSGNMLAHGAFSASFAPVSGNTPKVASGQVYVEISASSGEGFTTYLVHKWLDLMFRNQAYAQPATYAALLNQAGADADGDPTSKEVSGTAYARVLVNKTGGASPAWDDPASGACTNLHDITFPTVGSGGWTQIVGMCLVDAASNGNSLAYDNDQVVDQTPAENDTVKFPAGDLDSSMT